jgi:hypothetical protein
MKLEIETTDGQAVIDAEGDEPYDDAKFALDRLLGDEVDVEELERVFVVLQTNTVDADEQQPVGAVEKTSAGAGSDDTEKPVAGDGGAVARDPGADSVTTGPQDQSEVTDYTEKEHYGWLEENDREFGTTSSGTVQHVILSIVSAADETLNVAQLNERFPGPRKESISAACSQMYKKRLLNREEGTPDTGGKRYEYSLSPHGGQVLKERGRMAPSEWSDKRGDN